MRSAEVALLSALMSLPRWRDRLSDAIVFLAALPAPYSSASFRLLVAPVAALASAKAAALLAGVLALFAWQEGRKEGGTRSRSPEI